MAKHIETLGSYENFRAPWETEGGEDAEIDKTKLRRLIYNVRADLAKANTGGMAKWAPTVASLVLLICNHTLMHAGQFSVTRRALGKPVLF